MIRIFFIICIASLLIISSFGLKSVFTYAQTNPEVTDIERAEVTAVKENNCSSNPETTCLFAEVNLFSENTSPQLIELFPVDERTQYRTVNEGDIINVRVFNVNGENQYVFLGVTRDFPYILFFGGFVVLSIIVGGWKGLRSLIALTVSTSIIFTVLLPLIVDNPQFALVIGLVSVFIIFICNQLIGHGFNKNSYISIVSAGISTTFVLILSVSAAYVFRLTGLGNEGGLFIFDLVPEGLNLGDLFIVGTLLGLSGAVDDVNTTQIGVVKELIESDKSLSFWQVYSKSMNIGTSHLVSMVNTLFLAYIGAALPTMIIFELLNEPIWLLLAREDITEEIVRTLIASSGLLLAIPLTTYLASLVFVETKPRWFKNQNQKQA